MLIKLKNGSYIDPKTIIAIRIGDSNSGSGHRIIIDTHRMVGQELIYMNSFTDCQNYAAELAKQVKDD